MQAASAAYKKAMKEILRNHSFMRVTIGMINQTAQASAAVADPAAFTYFSSLKKPFDNYQVTELYEGCDQDWSAVDGSMYFLPREKPDVVLNAGLVTEELLGAIEIRFPVALSIKGLTVEFGKAYPVDFSIVSDQSTVEIKDNGDGHFVTEEIFEEATFLRFVPARMVNGQSRLRIHQITMGIGIYFDNQKILSASKKEHISPITEELPTIDFSMTAENRDRQFDIENSESSVQFLEIGQNVEVLHGQELEDGTVEWMPGAKLSLKDWSADDEELEISATDRFDTMEDTYYRGAYHPEGISLYDLADDVFQDAGVDSRDYYLDPYLKNVLVKNPVPAVAHKEALQLIANAGRCIIYQDREGKIFLKSSFIPDMAASAEDETYFSQAEHILDGQPKAEYGLAGQDYTAAGSAQYFLPHSGETTLHLGYISEAVADSQGTFEVNPRVTIQLEAAFKCFGLTLEFGRNVPQEVIFHAYYNNEAQESYTVSELEESTMISHEFPEFDRLVLEFSKGAPNNRVILDNVLFGDSTDYSLEYGSELTKTPKGTQLTKVKELQVIRTLYGAGAEEQELAKETVVFDEENRQYTFYLSNASYGFSAAITEPGDGQSVQIVSSSAYYVTVEAAGVSGAVEVTITGREYTVTQAKTVRQLHTTGTVETWENPLVSESSLAADLAQWVGDYLASDREYDLSYRGEPRLDANDIAFLENKYVPDLLIRLYDHTLNFKGGALSGTIKARRDMSGMVGTKNRLAGQ